MHRNALKSFQLQKPFARDAKKKQMGYSDYRSEIRRHRSTASVSAIRIPLSAGTRIRTRVRKFEYIWNRDIRADVPMFGKFTQLDARSRASDASRRSISRCRDLINAGD